MGAKVVDSTVLNIPLADLKTHPVNLEVYGQPTPDDVQSLAESLEATGLNDPLMVSENRVVLWGHRRLAAAEQLGWKSVACRQIDISDWPEWQVAEFILGNNAQRVKSNETKAAEYGRFLHIEETRAKERMADGGKGCQNSDTLRSDDSAAGKVGWSRDTARKALKVRQQVLAWEDSETEAEREAAGELLSLLNDQSVNAAWTWMQERVNERKPDSQPERTDASGPLGGAGESRGADGPERIPATEAAGDNAGGSDSGGSLLAGNLQQPAGEVSEESDGDQTGDAGTDGSGDANALSDEPVPRQDARDDHIERNIGALARDMDTRATDMKCRHSRHHTNCINAVSGLLDAFNEWRESE